MLVQVLAQEFARDGIRVNALSPGMVRTGMTARSTPTRGSPPSATRSSAGGGDARRHADASRSCSAPTRATSTPRPRRDGGVSEPPRPPAGPLQISADETISLRGGHMGKKLLFVGAGASALSRAFCACRARRDLVDPWPIVETIRERGISVTGPHEPFEARPAAIHVTKRPACRATTRSRSSP